MQTDFESPEIKNENERNDEMWETIDNAEMLIKCVSTTLVGICGQMSIVKIFEKDIDWQVDARTHRIRGKGDGDSIRDADKVGSGVISKLPGAVTRVDWFQVELCTCLHWTNMNVLSRFKFQSRFTALVCIDGNCRKSNLTGTSLGVVAY